MGSAFSKSSGKYKDGLTARPLPQYTGIWDYHLYTHPKNVTRLKENARGY